MSIKRFNPTLCRGRVWGVISFARAAQRGLTWVLGSRTVMETYRASLGFSNSRVSAHVVIIEPWAEDFTLLPGEAMTLIAHGNSAIPSFEIVELDGASQVFCNAASDFQALQGHVRLECGHNRQLDKDA